MRTLNCIASACRHCRFYTPEGRRGGHCDQLGVPVRGGWKACSLALPPFAPSWEELEALVTWSEESLMVQDAIPSDYTLKAVHLEVSESEVASVRPRSTASVLPV